MFFLLYQGGNLGRMTEIGLRDSSAVEGTESQSNMIKGLYMK